MLLVCRHTEEQRTSYLGQHRTGHRRGVVPLEPVLHGVKSNIRGSRLNHLELDHVSYNQEKTGVGPRLTKTSDTPMAPAATTMPIFLPILGASMSLYTLADDDVELDGFTLEANIVAVTPGRSVLSIQVRMSRLTNVDI
jgi:hypothetical protein